MTQQEFIIKVSSLLKLIRTEYSVTQEEMSVILGISKKTLVETEKRRRDLSWPETVAVATIFSSSRILQSEFGGDPSDIIRAIAFEEKQISYPITMGGKVWWKVIKEEGRFVIQQNLVSKHYRLLDDKNEKLISSFKLEEVEEYLSSIAGGK